MDFTISADHRVKLKENAKRDKYLDLTREWKKTTEHKHDGDTNSNWLARYTHQMIGTETGGIGNKRTRRYHPNYSIAEIGQNTKKSPGNLKRLAVTQTPLRNPQTSKIIILINLRFFFFFFVFFSDFETFY